MLSASHQPVCWVTARPPFKAHLQLTFFPTPASQRFMPRSPHLGCSHEEPLEGRGRLNPAAPPAPPCHLIHPGGPTEGLCGSPWGHNHPRTPPDAPSRLCSNQLFLSPPPHGCPLGKPPPHLCPLRRAPQPVVSLEVGRPAPSSLPSKPRAHSSRPRQLRRDVLEATGAHVSGCNQPSATTLPAPDRALPPTQRRIPMAPSAPGT